MTIAIGLIPDNDTVLLMQDSRTSWGNFVHADTARKMTSISDNILLGHAGSPYLGEEVAQFLKQHTYTDSLKLRAVAQEGYQSVREQSLIQGVVKRYGFSHPREILQPAQGSTINPNVVEGLLRAMNDPAGFPLDVILASIIEGPQLTLVNYPGVSVVQTHPKTYMVAGSGTPLAIERVNDIMANYVWSDQVTIEEGIECLLYAGIACKKSPTVGGPLEIAGLRRVGKNVEPIRPDRRKTNMVVYCIEQKVSGDTLFEIIAKMHNPDVSALEMAEAIKSKVKFGLEFNNYFQLDDLKKSRKKE